MMFRKISITDILEVDQWYFQNILDEILYWRICPIRNYNKIKNYRLHYSSWNFPERYFPEKIKEFYLALRDILLTEEKDRINIVSFDFRLDFRINKVLYNKQPQRVLVIKEYNPTQKEGIFTYIL